MKKLKIWLTLFWTFFKIGLFTFGGGYAMIPLIQTEISERKKWMAPEEILDIVVIAESTPGPISVNAATYVGYRVAGVLGAIFATLGLAIPSLVIIYVISLFLNQFMSIQIVAHAFLGIEAAIAVLITSAAIKLKKSIPSDGFNVVIISLIVMTILVINIFNWNFSSIYLIILGGIVGIVFDLLSRKTKKATKI